jgi:hypothetical protein
MAYTEYTGTVIPNTKDTTFEKDSKGFKLSTQEEIKDKVGNDWWHGPASLITAGVVGYGTKAAYDWLKSKETPTPPRIDPTFGGGPPDDTPPNNPPNKTVENKAPKGWEQILAKSEANAAAKAAEAAAKANPIPSGMTPSIPTAQPNVSGNPAGAFSQQPNYGAPVPAGPPPSQFDLSQLGQSRDPLAGRGFQQPAVPPQAAPSKAAAPTPIIESFVRDDKGNIKWPDEMSAAAKKGAQDFANQFPDQAKALAGEGKFAILGAGSGDNSIYNSYGKDLAKRLRNEVNQGQMIGHNENYTSRVSPAILGMSPDTALGKEVAALRATQTGGTHGQLGQPATIKDNSIIKGKNTVPGLVKAGGPALLLMSIADAANAAQQGKYAEAAAQGLDIATDYIPGVAQFKQGMSPSTAGAPVVPPQQIANAALLGSPYAQTDWAKKQRQKAGAGRGVAPPSAYQR